MAEKPDEETFENLKIRTVGGQDYEFETSNYTLLSEIKIKFLDATDRSDVNIENCIFLFSGKKLEDQLPFYSIYGLGSDMVIQAMILNDPKNS